MCDRQYETSVFLTKLLIKCDIFKKNSNQIKTNVREIQMNFAMLYILIYCAVKILTFKVKGKHFLACNFNQTPSSISECSSQESNVCGLRITPDRHPRNKAMILL